MRYGRDKEYHLTNSKNVPRKARRMARYHASKLWTELLWAGSVLRPTSEHRAHSVPTTPDVAHRLVAETLAEQWREANDPKTRQRRMQNENVSIHGPSGLDMNVPAPAHTMLTDAEREQLRFDEEIPRPAPYDEPQEEKED